MRHVALAALLLFVAACGSPTASPNARASAPADPTVAPSSGEAVPSTDLTGLVAYVGGADPQIYLLDLASGESVQLTHLTPADADLTGAGPMAPVLTCAFGPAGLQWSPDGERLAFMYGGCDGVVYVVDLEGTTQRVGEGRNPTWSPDGSQLVFEQNHPYLGVPGNDSWPLLRVDATLDDAAPVPLGNLERGLYAAAPSYSPDGALISFSGPPPGGAQDPTATAAYVMTRDGADLRAVADGVSPWGWLPDGRLVVIDPTTGHSAALDLHGGASTAIAGGDPAEAVSAEGWILATLIDAGGSRIRLYDADGKSVGEIGGFAPTWKPDGTAFLVTDVESATLGAFGLDGSELGTYRLVAPVGGDYRARWRPGSATP